MWLTAPFLIRLVIVVPYFLAAVLGLWGVSAILRGLSRRAWERACLKRGVCPVCEAPVAADAINCGECEVELRPELAGTSRWHRRVAGPALYGVAALVLSAFAYAFAAYMPTYLFGPQLGADYGSYRWYALAAGIFTFAVGLAAWGLWGDRSRGRKRCPMCWYNMAAVPALTCPECGHDAGSPRMLLRTRRRWHAVGLAVLVLLSAELARRGPQIQKGGWLAAVPTTFMIAALPLLPDAWLASRAYLGPGADPTLHGRLNYLDSWEWQAEWARSRALSLLKSRDPARWLIAAEIRGESLYWHQHMTFAQDLPLGFSQRLVNALTSPDPVVLDAAVRSAFIFTDACAGQMRESDPDGFAGQLVGIVRDGGGGQAGAITLLARLGVRSPAVVESCFAVLADQSPRVLAIRARAVELLASAAQEKRDLIPRLLAAARVNRGPDRAFIAAHLCRSLPLTPEAIAWIREQVSDPDIFLASAAIRRIIEVSQHAAEASEALFRRATENPLLISALTLNQDVRPFLPRVVELLNSSDAQMVEQAIGVLRQAVLAYGPGTLDPFRARISLILNNPRADSPEWAAFRELMQVEPPADPPNAADGAP